MRIFRLGTAYDENGNALFRQIWPADLDSVDWLDVWSFRCVSRAGVRPRDGVLVEYLNRDAPRGNFPFLEGGAVGIDRITYNRLATAIPRNSEALEVHTADRQSFILLNILDCADCIDEDRSEWRSIPQRARVTVTRFAFRPERLPDVSLFKAKASSDDIFVQTGLVPPHRDFKALYEELGLKGLHFSEVWNDEGDPIPAFAW